jgi:WhiB family redox-sensing transcriptional regulator
VNEDWRDEAACRDYPTELFFPPKGKRDHKWASIKVAEQVKQAKRVCMSCPVLQDCRNYILSEKRQYTDDYGIFGGWTPEDRHSSTVAARDARRKSCKQ